MLRDTERIMRRQHIAKLIEAQPFCLHADVEPEQSGFLRGLKPFDLQMMFRQAYSRVSGVITKPSVGSDFIQHALK